MRQQSAVGREDSGAKNIRAARGRNAGGKGGGGLTVWTIWAMSFNACSRLSRHTLMMWVSSTTTGWFAASISLIIGAVMGPVTAPSSCAVARSGGAGREVFWVQTSVWIPT